MKRLIIPLFYALPIWGLFLVASVTALATSPYALAAKHGGLVFPCLFFWVMSLVPIAIFSGDQSHPSILRLSVRRLIRFATLCGMIGAACLSGLYILLQVAPIPVAVPLGIGCPPLILVGGPFFVRYRIARTA